MSAVLPPLSIRVRLTLWYALVLLAILVAISAISYAVLEWSLRHDQDLSLAAVGEAVRDSAARLAPSASPPAIPEELLRELVGPELLDEFFQLRGGDGAPRAYSSRPDGRQLPVSLRARENAARGLQTFETVTVPELGRVRLLTMPGPRVGRVSELVQVGLPLRRTDAALRRYRQILFGLVPLGVGLAAAGGSVIARHALRPVDTMARTAWRISAEDLSERVPTTGTGDELDRLAATFNTMLGRLEAAFAELRRFAAEAAHELRTPLTALKGGMEVALRADRPAGEYRRVLQDSLEEVEHVIRLAEDLLLLSRATAGLEVPRAPVDLEPLVLEVADAGLALARGTGVTVRIGELMPATVRGDGAALRRAVLNLVDNAVRHTREGGTVELSLGRSDGEAAIRVTDTGVGIEGHDLDRIFEPFVRLQPERARDARGTGLGLPIARSIVVAHGGSLAVRSTPGVGSELVIRLPLAMA